jgi:D-arabinose 1-dehydrogenase-like Zn-dependent alcohol dehydrogenase
LTGGQTRWAADGAVVCHAVQVIDIDYVNEAMTRMVKGDVHFRFVIDINKSLVM